MTWTWNRGEAATYLVTTGYLKGEWMHCEARVYSQTSLDSEIAIILGKKCNLVSFFVPHRNPKNQTDLRRRVLPYTRSRTFRSLRYVSVSREEIQLVWRTRVRVERHVITRFAILGS
jgi:hypothetical protein